MFSFKEYADYFIGGSLFLCAPMIPKMLSVPVTHINDGLTLTIQVLSILLLLMRLNAQAKKNDSDAEE